MGSSVTERNESAMKLGWRFKSIIAIGALSVILAGCSGSIGGMSEMDHSKMNMEGTKETVTAGI